MKAMAESMNVFLDDAAEDMTEYLVEPSVHPPTATNTFSRGLRLFRFTKRSRASVDVKKGKCWVRHNSFGN